MVVPPPSLRFLGICHPFCKAKVFKGFLPNVAGRSTPEILNNQVAQEIEKHCQIAAEQGYIDGKIIGKAPLPQGSCQHHQAPYYQKALLGIAALDDKIY